MSGWPKAPRPRRWAGALLALLCGASATGLRAQPAELRIGQIVSLAPGLADAGREMAQGSKACADWVNAAGGVQGRRLRLVVRDDGGEPRAALERARALASTDSIAALLTPMGRGANAQILPWAAQEGLAVVAPYGAGAVATQAARLPTSFFLRTHPSIEALRLTTQLQLLGIARIAVLYGDDELGRETLAVFEEALASTGASAAAVVPLRTGEAARAVGELLRGEPQAVLLATVGGQTQAALRELQRQSVGGRGTVPYALSLAISQQELLALDAVARGLVVSQVLPAPESGAVPLVRTYHEALRLAGNLPPSYPGLEGCVAVLTLAQALRRGPQAATRAGALKALQAVGLVDLGGWTVDLADRERPGSRFTDITLVGADGRWKR